VLFSRVQVIEQNGTDMSRFKRRALGVATLGLFVLVGLVLWCSGALRLYHWYPYPPRVRRGLCVPARDGESTG
jgi:hypothetical protein